MQGINGLLISNVDYVVRIIFKGNYACVMKSNKTIESALTNETKRMFQYSIVISPGEPIIDHLNLIRQKLNHFIRLGSESLYSHTHISILDMKQADEDLVIGKLINVLSSQDRFPVILNGAAIQFQEEDKRSLYIPIANPVPIQVLNKLLSSEFGYPMKTFIPRLNIAESISIEDIKIIDPILPQFSFQGEFLCESVMILKKTVDSKNENWETAAKISFG